MSIDSRRNFVKEAWIKLALDRELVHALKTLTNEDVRSSLLSESEWEEFLSLIVRNNDKIKKEARAKSYGRSLPFSLHLILWLMLLILWGITCVWWIGVKSGWWGPYRCHVCSSGSLSGFDLTPEETKKDFLMSNSKLNTRQSKLELIHEETSTVQNHGHIILNSHSSDQCRKLCNRTSGTRLSNLSPHKLQSRAKPPGYTGEEDYMEIDDAQFVDLPAPLPGSKPPVITSEKAPIVCPALFVRESEVTRSHRIPKRGESKCKTVAKTKTVSASSISNRSERKTGTRLMGSKSTSELTASLLDSRTVTK